MQKRNVIRVIVVSRILTSPRDAKRDRFRATPAGGFGKKSGGWSW